MTKEELDVMQFRFEAHLASEDGHSNIFTSADGRISLIVHTPYRNGHPCGRTYRHFKIDGNVYYTQKAFYEALEKFKP